MVSGGDVYLEWGGDLELDQSGGIQLAFGWDEVRQRIMRRLLTNPRFKLSSGLQIPPGYIFDIGYGIGARRLLGEPVSSDLYKRLIQAVNSAVLVDEGVDVSKPPDIRIFKQPNQTLWVQITVWMKDQTPGKIIFSYAPGG